MTSPEDWPIETLRTLALMHGVVAYQHSARTSNQRWYLRTGGDIKTAVVIPLHCDPDGFVGRVSERKALWDYLVEHGVALERVGD